jgi:hypothetical protein
LLHETAEVAEAIAHAKEVDMIAGDTKVKEGNPMLENSIPQARKVFDSVESAAQQEITVMAAMRHMIDVSGQDVSVCTRHGEPPGEFWLEAERGYEISVRKKSCPRMEEWRRHGIQMAAARSCARPRRL